MADVTELGYLGIGVKDMEAWKKFAGEVVGMQVVDEGEGDRFYLRMDYNHHRIVVHDSGEDDLIYSGWRVAGPQELAEMKQQLTDHGTEFTEGTPAECQERRVLDLVKFTDPGGNPTEIYHGPQVDTHSPFHPARPMHGKFTTDGEGIGHMILRQPNPPAAIEFYTKVLGMRGTVEYKLPMPGAPDGMAQPMFLHCNGRDHSLAFGFPMDKRINHLMIEVDNLNDVGNTHDIVRQTNTPVAIQLGAHANDQMFSFYFGNPSGWLFEYGYGARKSTHQSEYYIRDTYGHQPESTGFGMDIEM